MGLLDMFGGSDATPTPTPTGGGMFDAYSPQNQTNLQMAMMADIVGNVMGKDVNAMQTAMPLVENARKLRLQQQETASFNKMVGGMSPEMQAIANNAPQGLRNTIMQGYISNMNQAKPVTGGKTWVGPNGALLQRMSDGSVKKVSGLQARGDTIHFGGKKMDEASATQLIKLEAGMDQASVGASDKLGRHNNMLRMLEAKDSTTDSGYKTDFGLSTQMTLEARKFYNSFVRSFGGEDAIKAIGLSDTTIQTIFTSQNKDLALLAAALMKGNLSEKELDFSVDLFSQIGNTREANIVLTKLGMMRERLSIDLNSHMIEWRDKLYGSNPDMGADGMLRGFRAEANKFRRARALENDASAQIIYHDLDLLKKSGMSAAALKLLKERKVEVTPYAPTDDGLDDMSPAEVAKILSDMN